MVEMESETKQPQQISRMSDSQHRAIEALLQVQVIAALRLNRGNANAGACKNKSNKYRVSDASLLQKEPPIHSNDLFIIYKSDQF